LEKRLSAHRKEAPRFHLGVAAHAPRFVDEVQRVDTAPASDRIRGMQLDADEAEFEPRMGKSGRGRGSSLAQLRATISIAGRSSRSRPSRPPAGPVARTGLRAHFAKGSKGQAKPTFAAQRRVVVKARYVVHGTGRAALLRMHVSYLAREAKASRSPAEPAVEKGQENGLQRSVDYLAREGREAAPGISFYNQRESGVDAQMVTSGWADDARHFRLIISAEDGPALGDLRPFIREVMVNLDARLGTRLEWVAVDHHDTDNPHSHVLIRGKRGDGQDLFIPSRLISSGIREHAQEVVTRVLGPRLGVDLAREREREIREVGVTTLDRELKARLRRDGGDVSRPDLVARLEQLERWGLAAHSSDGWRLADGLTHRLGAMKEYAEVERAVAHLQRGEAKALLAADAAAPVLGELVHARLDDQFGDNFLAVVETGVSELRYARFDRADDLAVLADAPPGAIVAFEPAVARPRPSDEAVARVAARTGGVYSAGHHASVEPHVDGGLVAANVRRLEAMRRSGFVARRADGVFEIAPDHLERATKFEAQLARKAPVTARVVSYWTLAEQVNALGPTHLDHVLTGEALVPKGDSAFARRYAMALQQRRLLMIGQGWMGEADKRLSPSVLRTLASNERADLAKRLSGEFGRPVLTQTPARLRGLYARRVDLAQGRVAVILQERQAYVVPWRPALERFAGREVEGVLRGQTLSWGLVRGLGPNLPPMG
jgi:hypothetical protein